MNAPRYDPAEIKRRLAFLDLLAHEGIDVRRAGGASRTGGGLHVAICPFHQEKSGSFTVYSYPDHEQDHAHCFGCGWNGDIIDFWIGRRGGDFVSALAPLASLASVSPSVFEEKRVRAAHRVPRMTGAALEQKENPALPAFSKLMAGQAAALAGLRGLSVEGIQAAAVARRVGWVMWPQWQPRQGFGVQGSGFRTSPDAAPCWVVTDRERRVAQFRRLDGEKFRTKDEREIKAWTKGSPTWPLGAAEIGDRGCVLLVEGGADMLAAFHFLWQFHRLETVAVCAMLGASCAINDDALPFFARKRVRIIQHADIPKDGRDDEGRKRRVLPGTEAAARWSEQLIATGAAVETFNLGASYRPEDLARWSNYEIGAAEIAIDLPGLVRRDGELVSDLNDLALCDESVWLDGELRSAFLDFDF